MDTSFGNDLSETQTAGGSGVASEQKPEGLCPVFIKQLLNSEESSFSMFKKHFAMVCCAAIVRSIETSSTKITYLLEDFTGQIEGHYWLEEGDESEKLAPEIMLNNYAIVYGNIRIQGNQKSLMIFRMLPIKDPNAICTHGLESLNAYYKSQKYFQHSDENFGSNGNGHTSIGGMSSTQNIASGLDSKHRAVFDAVREDCTNTQGISREALQKKFYQIQPKELSAILDFLISEGHIYSSFDADHFLVTE